MPARALWVALTLSWVVPVAAARVAVAGEAAERRLDPELKLLYRALQAERGVSAADAAAKAGASELSRSERALALLERVRGGGSRLGNRAASGTSSAEPRLRLLVRSLGEAAALERAGFRVQARIGQIYTGWLPVSRLVDLAEVPEVVFVQTSHELRAQANSFLPALAAPLSPARLPAAAFAMPAARSDQARANVAAANAAGTGAIVGYVDTGVDIFHEEFRTSGGQTRIKYLLDFSAPGDVDGDGVLDGPGCPDGSGADPCFGGTLYSESDINLALSLGSFAAKDLTGHGTHGLSVAVGDDAVSPGMAPSADLIVVKATRKDGTLAFESVDIINALSFVDARAQELGRPYVVNLSLGTLFSSHDGRSLEEQAIDALVGPGIAGKAVVVAAGNSSENRSSHYKHLSGTAYVGLESGHTLHVPTYTAKPGNGNDRVPVDVWYEGRDKHTLIVRPPAARTDCGPVEVPYGDYADVQTACGDVVIMNMGGASPQNGDTEALVLIDDWTGTAPAGGDWTVVFRGEEVGADGSYNGWLSDDSIVGAETPYLTAGADGRLLVGKPGGAYNAITVGSFAEHDAGSRFRTSWVDVNGTLRVDDTAVDGDISDFSSPGGTRDGRVKPELAAPGERVLGAVSGAAYPPGVTPPPGFETSASSIYQYRPTSWSAEALITDRTVDHGFGLLQGTSFAAPVVTGVVARILSTNAALDAVQVRNMLVNSALVDGFVTAGGTRAVPNDLWGYGKLDTAVGATTPLPSDLRISADTLPDGVVGRPYSVVLTASGGTLPYTWSIAGGSLPGGLTLSGALLAGTPLTAGQSTFTIRVTDASVPSTIATRALTIRIEQDARLQVSTSVLKTGRVGLPYEAALQAEGGTPPYTWSLLAGTLPAGLSLEQERIAGTPEGPERTAFTVRVQDSLGAVAVRSLTLRVRPDTDDFWRPLGGEGGVPPDAITIAIDPRDSRHVVLATWEGEVFESWNAGEQWTRINRNNLVGLQQPFFPWGHQWTRSRINPATSDVWAIEYMHNGIGLYERSQSAWLYRDLCPTASLAVRDLQFDQAGSVYVLTLGSGCPEIPSYSLLRSDDRGSTWRVQSTLSPGIQSVYGYGEGNLSVYRSMPSFLYASRQEIDAARNYIRRAFRSVDGGASWTDIGGALNASGYSVPVVRVSQSDPLDVMMVTPGGVARSLDGGNTWTSSTLGFQKDYLERSDLAPQVAWVGGVGTVGIYKTTDGGIHWTRQVPALGGTGTLSSPRVIALDPNDPDALFLATWDGAVVRSSDGGDTWTLRRSGLMRQSLNGISIDPTRPADVLAGSLTGPVVSRSGGRKWTSSSNGWTGGSGGGTAISATAPGVYYAQGGSSLYRSGDRGISWERVMSLGDLDAAATTFVFDLDPFDANHLIVSAHSYSSTGLLGIWSSSDGGRTWTLVRQSVGPYWRATPASFAKDRPGRVYVTDQTGIYRSEDGGLSWPLWQPNTVFSGCSPTRLVSAPSRSDYVYAGGCWFQGETMSIFYFDPAIGVWRRSETGIDDGMPAVIATGVAAFAVDAADPLTAYAGISHTGGAGMRSGIVRTTDGGRSWTRLSAVFDSYSIWSIALGPTGGDSILVSTEEGPVFRSVDRGKTWTEILDFGTVADVTTVTVRDPSNPSVLYVGTEGYGVQVSTDGGKTFVSRSTGLGNYNVNAIAFDPVTPTTVYAGTDAGIYKSTNAANTWTPTAQGTGRITDIVIDTDGGAGRLIWGTVEGQGVTRSLDQGATFQMFSTGLASLELTSLELDHTGTGRLIWGTTKGGDGVVYSDDDGVTWKSAAGNGLTNRGVHDVGIQSGSGRLIWGTGRLIWATTDNGVFYSRDGGQSWKDLSLGLPSGVPVTSASIDPNTDEVLVSLYGEEAGGVYRGGNVTGLWTAVNAGLEDLTVRKLTNDGGHAVDATTRATTYYASTARRGVFAAELKTVAGAYPRITTTAMSQGKLRQPYSQMLTAADGTPPYRWSLLEGSLPAGLTLDASGRVSGSPSAVGHYSFRVQVADQASRVDNGELVLTVVEGTTPGGLPQLSVGDVSRPEGQSGTTTFAFPVTLSPPSAAPVTVSFLTASGTAVSGSDFTALSGTLTFAANETAKTIGIVVSGDRRPEDDEVFYVNLSAAVGATVARAQGVGRILDDDTGASDFYTVTPCRVLDTRQPSGPTLGAPLTCGIEKAFAVAGKCGVLSSAKAVSLNLTGTGSTAQGNLRLFAAGTPAPLASSLNYVAGQTRANNAVAPLGTGGQISVLCSPRGATHVILDVNGYFEQPTDSGDGSRRFE